MSTTVQWYKEFGEEWWGNISTVLTPFPEVQDKKVVEAKTEPKVGDLDAELIVDKNDDLTLKNGKNGKNGV